MKIPGKGDCILFAGRFLFGFYVLHHCVVGCFGSVFGKFAAALFGKLLEPFIICNHIAHQLCGGDGTLCAHGAADGSQEFKVAGFAAGNGVHQYGGQALVHGFRGTQSAGFGDEQVGGVHITAHAVHEAEDHYLLAVYQPAQIALQYLVVAADGYQQRVVRQGLRKAYHQAAHAVCAHSKH